MKIDNHLVGRAINALGNAVKPGMCPNHMALDPNDALRNATQGIMNAHQQLQVAPLLHAAELIHPEVRKLPHRSPETTTCFC